MSAGRPASDAQKRYCYDLARKTGRRVPAPRNSAHASREINRMRQMLGDSTPSERQRERRDISYDIGDSARVGKREVVGYGSSARWAGTETA